MEESAKELSENLDIHLEEILGKIRQRVAQIKVRHVPYYPGVSTNFIFGIADQNHAKR